MLVDKKFYYISLPRCGSTSFHFSCLRQYIPIQTLFEDVDLKYQSINIDNFTNKEISVEHVHRHEPLIHLQERFGEEYPIIAVRRDRHETFISLWKQIVQYVKVNYEQDVYEKFFKFTINEVLFFKQSEFSVDYLKLEELANEFLKINNIEWGWYLSNMMIILYAPKSIWHGNHKDIIWFDFDKLNEMEDWVSFKLGKPFKLENFNTSKYVESNIKLDDHFRSKYNSIYDIYDIRKTNNTLV